MEQLHELLKNGDVNFVSQITFTETIQKILEELSDVYSELETAKTSTVNNVLATKEPLSYSPDRLKDTQEQVELRDIQIKAIKNELVQANQAVQNIGKDRDEINSKLYETQAHLAEVRDLINQYREAYGELPEPTKDPWETGEPDVVEVQKEADDSIPSKLPEPFATDDFSDGTAEKDNIIISTIKKVIDKVTPDKSVLEEAVTALDNLTDETELTFDSEELLKPIKELPAKPSLIDPTTPKPKFWTCQCGRDNNMKKVRCSGCGKSKAAQTVV